ncbi:stress response protein NST1 [Fundulus heteroclitus]|uniref:stress response protein NST1 n=1 Tax=Fundulus heteroclitus TaxID=8078 RepID=UPI00165BA4DE|nr:stress response protein NST1 [Fundulus heteroclitus]XP_036000675.1 stress response protein NST1 [Fundulus heteroclitus]
MAAAERGTNDGSSMKRCGSNEIIRPDMSEQNNGDEDGSLTMTVKAKAPLNLLLFGRKGAGKTSAAKAILGQTELHSASKISESVKNQGEVSGRWVSVVELPALYGRSEQEVMEESFRCVSLCDPEGVHAFILVLPVGPLTDEDKGELQTIQDTFSSVVNDFTMILFTVESDPKAPDVVKIVEKDRDIQELINSCGRRYVVVNVKDQQQVPELLEMVETISGQRSIFFSKDMFIRVLIGRSVKPKTELQDVKHKIEEDRQSREPLRKEIEVKDKKEEQQKKQREEIKALQAQLEQEKKQKVQLLKEKDDSLEKEREKREKEHEEDKRKWKKLNESQWKQKFDALEKLANFEREQREAAEKRLDQCTGERIRERNAWDKEKDKIWKQTHQELKQNLQEKKKELEDEKTRYKMLQEEFSRKRRKWNYVFVTFLLLLFFVILGSVNTR